MCKRSHCLPRNDNRRNKRLKTWPFAQAGCFHGSVDEQPLLDLLAAHQTRRGPATCNERRSYPCNFYWWRVRSSDLPCGADLRADLGGSAIALCRSGIGPGLKINRLGCGKRSQATVLAAGGLFAPRPDHSIVCPAIRLDWPQRACLGALLPI